MKHLTLSLGLVALGAGLVHAGSSYEETLTHSLRGYQSHHEVPVQVVRQIADRYGKTFSSVFADLRFTEEAARKAAATRAPEPAPRPAPAPAPVMPASYDSSLLPPSPQPGHCYTRLLVPATYRTEYREVLAADGSQSVEIRPAEFRDVEKTVLVREASTRYEVQAPEYKWVEEKVMVTPASTRLVEVAAEYRWVEEKVLDVAAHQIWKRGRGPFEKFDNTTGEIMCLVEVPATYKTVKKKVLVSPASVKEVQVPARYETVKRKVLVSEGKVVPVEVPAQYKTITVREQVRPAEYQRQVGPDRYQKVAHKVLVNPAHMEWREILCETNVTPDVVRALQRALEDEGYDPGPVDGRLGAKTRTALSAFQKANRLASGSITSETVRALGVKVQGRSVLR